MRIQRVFSEMVQGWCQLGKEEGALVVRKYWVRFAGPAGHQVVTLVGD